MPTRSTTKQQVHPIAELMDFIVRYGQTFEMDNEYGQLVLDRDHT